MDGREWATSVKPLINESPSAVNWPKNEYTERKPICEQIYNTVLLKKKWTEFYLLLNSVPLQFETMAFQFDFHRLLCLNLSIKKIHKRNKQTDITHDGLTIECYC